MNQEWHYEEGMSAVDFLLANNPTEFQLQLLNLGRRFHWDENDPGFAVPLVVCRIDRVLDVYPEKIRREMEEITQRLEGRWKTMEVALNAAAARGTQAGERADDYLAEAQAIFELGTAQAQDVLADERQAMLQVMTQERDSLRQLLADERQAAVKLLSNERKAIAQQAAESAKQQERALHTQAAASVAKNIAAAQEGANLQVKEVIKGVREKHYWEAVAYACLAALSLASIAWLGGWVTSRQMLATSTWSDIQRWNEDELKACQDVGKATCNFHIEVPK
ncbi:hypothetical protein [cf. Phormidesmis sp. LEGE 11477]|uniref:hypothetical protein n=1 Tax=cf. Phormidesmis sp. LEGE 11477 TaxID=1828680 RepID=UPI001882A622|nr:hypothetical protein [cf. Phormidesmis sp. LEGE 11477]MBE9063456.1 hypothetical protein [cf. Phormidesmis sp. LEGE 11477]